MESFAAQVPVCSGIVVWRFPPVTFPGLPHYDQSKIPCFQHFQSFWTSEYNIYSTTTVNKENTRTQSQMQQSRNFISLLGRPLTQNLFQSQDIVAISCYKPNIVTILKVANFPCVGDQFPAWKHIFNILGEFPAFSLRGFSRNTQSWQCWQLRTTSNANKSETVTSLSSFKANLHYSLCLKDNWSGWFLYLTHLGSTKLSTLPTLCITGKLDLENTSHSAFAGFQSVFLISRHHVQFHNQNKNQSSCFCPTSRQKKKQTIKFQFLSKII